MHNVCWKIQEAVERWEILLTQDLLPWSHKKKLSFWHKSFIRHLHISPKYTLPPNLLHNLGFWFPLGISVVPKEIEENACAKFWGANKVYYGRCANGELTTLVWSRWLDNGLVLFCVLTELTFTTDLVHKNANKKNFGQYPAMLTSWTVSKAQFKHRTFHVPDNTYIHAN